MVRFKELAMILCSPSERRFLHAGRKGGKKRETSNYRLDRPEETYLKWGQSPLSLKRSPPVAKKTTRKTISKKKNTTLPDVSKGQDDSEQTLDFLSVDVASSKDRLPSDIEMHFLTMKSHFDRLTGSLRYFLNKAEYHKKSIAESRCNDESEATETNSQGGLQGKDKKPAQDKKL
jgi:hypothetical protein